MTDCGRYAISGREGPTLPHAARPLGGPFLLGPALKPEDLMSKKLRLLLLLVLAALSCAAQAGAQAPPATPAPPPLPYGAPIGLEDAKKAAAAAVEEVKKIGAAPNAIAIVDHGGFLIYFERMDNTQLGSVEFA